MVVMFDPGHGGSDPGAVANGLLEKDVALTVSLAAMKVLVHKGWRVLLTRASDESLTIQQRWRRANKCMPDLFVSVHVNAGGGSGSEAFFFDGDKRSEDSKLLSELVSASIAELAGFPDRGAKADTRTAVGSLGVLRRSVMTASLVELAFIDAPAFAPDVELLRYRCGLFAHGLAVGVIRFAEVAKKGGDLMRFNSLEQIKANRSWAFPTVKKLIDRGFINGGGVGLDLSDDMLRLLVIQDRAGCFDISKLMRDAI